MKDYVLIWSERLPTRFLIVLEHLIRQLYVLLQVKKELLAAVAVRGLELHSPDFQGLDVGFVVEVLWELREVDCKVQLQDAAVDVAEPEAAIEMGQVWEVWKFM